MLAPEPGANAEVGALRAEVDELAGDAVRSPISTAPSSTIAVLEVLIERDHGFPALGRELDADQRCRSVPGS